jgi:hypothetical protein
MSCDIVQTERKNSDFGALLSKKRFFGRERHENNFYPDEKLKLGIHASN